MPDDTEMHGSACSAEDDGPIDVDYYRKLVKQFIDMRRYQSALFWAEKVCILTQNEPKDVYCQAHCMFLLKEYHRAAYLIRSYDLEKTHIPSYNLLLESLYESKEFNEAVSVINSVDIEYLASSLINQPLDCDSYNSRSVMFCEDTAKNELLASVCYLKGKIYEAMDNRVSAMDFYVQALQRSVFCYEALEALVQHEMLMAWEEKELMQHLPFSTQASEADAKFIRKLYECKLKKYYETLSPPGDDELAPICGLKSVKDLREKLLKKNPTEAPLNKPVIPKVVATTNTTGNTTATQILSPANKLLEDLKSSPFSLHVSLTRASCFASETQRTQPANEQQTRAENCNKETIPAFTLPLSICFQRIPYSVDSMAAEAERLFYECEYNKSSKILNEVLKIDPYHNGALTILIGCLVEFGDYNKLFYTAHKLVDRYPDKAISWYAVGCYYDLIGKSDPARRFLSKATTLDRLYGPAWLAYGHSFAKENEHDQAMAAYFKATQLMRGCHFPLLYIGVECGLTKNLELSEKFFYQAMTIAPMDVFVLHELGVIKYEYEQYDSAEDVFRAAVDIVTQRAKANKEEISARWEPLFNNLGHCCRKTKKYEEALAYHQYSLLLKPQTPQTYTAIGFVHALMGNLEEAITYFHKSLAINRDCTITSTILKACIEDLMNDQVMQNIYIEYGSNQASTSEILPLSASGSASSSSSAHLFPRHVTMKRLSPIEEADQAMTTGKMRLRLNEDEELTTHSDPGDINATMDMSLDS